MSHSCTPNCQAIVMACGGRLTIALYTLRHVYEGTSVGGLWFKAGHTCECEWRLRCAGEELTFDYSSVTESEKEFRDAICLCSTRNCRRASGMGLGMRPPDGWAAAVAVLPGNLLLCFLMAARAPLATGAPTSISLAAARFIK